MKLFKHTAVVTLSLISAALSGCYVSSSPDMAQYVANALSNDYYSSAGYTYTYYVAKRSTDRGGGFVVFQASNGFENYYYAYNLSGMPYGMSTSDTMDWLYYYGQADTLDYIGGNSYYSGYTGYYYEATQASSKDLELAAAVAEGAMAKLVAENMQAKFGLSAERSFELAKLMNKMNKISKSRGVTEADADALAKEAAGFSMADAKKAAADLVRGDRSALNSLIEKAAAVNETSPEHMSQIVDSFIRN